MAPDLRRRPPFSLSVEGSHARDPGHATECRRRLDANLLAPSLRRWNIALGALHALQALAILALATAFALPVTASFLSGPPGHPEPPRPRRCSSIPMASGVALFLLLSAGFHALVSLPRVSDRYMAGLMSEHNFYRWAEYSLSSSVMVVLIAMLTGISDVAALIAIFASNAAMIFFGAVQERYESPGGSLWPFWLGCVIGVAPWLAIGVYLWSPGSSAEPPDVRLSRSSGRSSSSSTCSRSTCGCSTGGSAAGARISSASGLHGAEPRGEVAPRLAGVRRNARRMMRGCRPWHDAKMVRAR